MQKKEGEVGEKEILATSGQLMGIPLSSLCYFGPMLGGSMSAAGFQYTTIPVTIPADALCATHKQGGSSGLMCP